VSTANTQNTIDRKEHDKGQQGAGTELMKDKQVLTLPMHRNDFLLFFCRILHFLV